MTLPPNYDSASVTTKRSGRRIAGRVVAVVVIAVVVALIALPGSPKSAQATVVDSVGSVLADRTAHVTVSLSGASGSTVFTAQGSGSVDFSTGAMQLQLDANSSGQTLSLQVVYLGGTIYEDIPGLDRLAPGKSWISIDLSSLLTAAAQDPSPLGSASNPAAVLRILAQRGNNVDRLGPSTVDGVAVQGYLVTFNPLLLKSQKLQAKLPAWMRAALAHVNFYSTTGKVYVDQSGRLHRVSFHMTVNTGRTTTVDETLDFSAYGSPVSIAAPRPDQVVTFQQLLQDVQAASVQAASGPATQASTCIQPIPNGASPAAIDYLQAVNGDYPAWVQVTNMMEANGDQVDLATLQVQSRVDARFLLQLRAIQFTGTAARPAAALETAVSAYLSDMAAAQASKAVESPALNSDMEAMSTGRAESSAALRSALGLPPSSCLISRP